MKHCLTAQLQAHYYALVLLITTVARYGHTADLFFTPRAHVNHVY